MPDRDVLSDQGGRPAIPSSALQRMRWPYTSESMGQYADYMRDLLVDRGQVVTAADFDRLRAENERLRAELGRRDDVLYSIGKAIQAYEDTIHPGLALTSDENDAPKET